MSSSKFKNSEIRKILLVTLSNIGDIVLTFPVIDALKKDFPEAQLTVVVGPKGAPLLQGNPYLYDVCVFDKHQPWLKSWTWIRSLRRERFDLVVDLRNTAIPFLTGARHRTAMRVLKAPPVHMRDKHLRKLGTVYTSRHVQPERCALFISKADEQVVDEIVRKDIGSGNRFVVVAPGAADSAKRWPEARFAALCDWLMGQQLKVVFVGDRTDREVIARIQKAVANPGVDVSGRASLRQVSALLQLSSGAIVNDSAPMHLASYLDVPVLALFGPTNPALYGPWSRTARSLRRNSACVKCARPKDSLAHTCMRAITVEDVKGCLIIPSAGGRITFKNA